MFYSSMSVNTSVTRKKNPKFEKKKGFKKKEEKLSAHSHIKTRLFYGNKIKQVSPQAKFSK